MAVSNGTLRGAAADERWPTTVRRITNMARGTIRVAAQVANVLSSLAGALLFAALLLVLAGVALIHRGWYNVAATEGQTRLGAVALEYVVHRSVQAHARWIIAPPLSASRALRGAVLYREACEICHRAPGGVRSPVALAMLPVPADLAGSTDWTPAELFWIVKHGIAMTGMPAWRGVYRDEEIWDIVAFVDDMPNLSPEQYQKLQTRGSGRSESSSNDALPSSDHGAARP